MENGRPLQTSYSFNETFYKAKHSIASKMSARIPPLIQPYLSLPPESSLVLLTSVLGASANWLVLRYLQELLKPASALQNNHEHVSIFLVSFLRDFSFWKDGSSRLGLDLEAAAQRGLFKYLDGLQVLVCSNEDRRYNPIVPETTSGWRQPLQSQSLVAIANRIKEGLMHLKRAPLTGFDKGHSLEPKKVVLVLDGLDLLLATLESPRQDGEETLIAFRDMLIDMREVSSTGSGTS